MSTATTQRTYCPLGEEYCSNAAPHTHGCGPFVMREGAEYVLLTYPEGSFSHPDQLREDAKSHKSDVLLVPPPPAALRVLTSGFTVDIHLKVPVFVGCLPPPSELPSAISRLKLKDEALQRLNVSVAAPKLDDAEYNWRFTVVHMTHTQNDGTVTRQTLKTPDVCPCNNHGGAVRERHEHPNAWVKAHVQTAQSCDPTEAAAPHRGRVHMLVMACASCNQSNRQINASAVPPAPAGSGVAPLAAANAAALAPTPVCGTGSAAAYPVKRLVRTVYKTPTGTKYHFVEGCYGASIPMIVDVASAPSYDFCSRCSTDADLHSVPSFVEEAAMASADLRTVYKTPSGKKYHLRLGCYGASIPVTIDIASVPWDLCLRCS